MKNINDFPEIAEALFIGNLNVYLNNKEKVTLPIKTIYIAPPAYLISGLNITGLEILPFQGGFKTGSLILFSLESENDIKYFNKITGYYIGKKGELISHTKTNL
jgi:hypothetical protein